MEAGREPARLANLNEVGVAFHSLPSNLPAKKRKREKLSVLAGGPMHFSIKTQSLRRKFCRLILFPSTFSPCHCALGRRLA